MATEGRLSATAAGRPDACPPQMGSVVDPVPSKAAPSLAVTTLM